MAANINIELFKRYAPKKKLEIINALTENEFLAITNKTILRIIKEEVVEIATKQDASIKHYSFLMLATTGIAK